jgi:hypothetical protein
VDEGYLFPCCRAGGAPPGAEAGRIGGRMGLVRKNLTLRAQSATKGHKRPKAATALDSPGEILIMMSRGWRF